MKSTDTPLWVQYIREAVATIRAKPVRSSLSLLGVYIGSLAVLGILAIHRGASEEMDRLFSTRGAQILFARILPDTQSSRIRSFKISDADRIPIGGDILSTLPRTTLIKPIGRLDRTESGTFFGADRSFFPIYRIAITNGRNFSPEETRVKAPVCILTEETAKRFFPFSQAVGSDILIDGKPVEVIGVAAWDEAAAVRTLTSGPTGFLPPRWMARTDQTFSFLEIRIKTDASLTEAKRRILEALSQGSASLAAHYEIHSLDYFFTDKRALQNRIAGGLLVVAVISLLIGGIGIANLMLISVSERTSEIGLRKALGARPKDVLLQFLIEAAIVSAAGGAAAAFTAYAAVFMAPFFTMTPIPLSLPLFMSVACTGFTTLIGLLSGLYPASHAAQLAPVEALRYE